MLYFTLRYSIGFFFYLTRIHHVFLSFAYRNTPSHLYIFRYRRAVYLSAEAAVFKVTHEKIEDLAQVRLLRSRKSCYSQDAERPTATRRDVRTAHPPKLTGRGAILFSDVWRFGSRCADFVICGSFDELRARDVALGPATVKRVHPPLDDNSPLASNPLRGP